MDQPVPPPSANKAQFEYNVKFMERTFRTRTATEQLLSAEREAGNITTHDYEVAMRFFPIRIQTVQYETLGALLSGTLAFQLRRPSWTARKTIPLILLAVLLGEKVGATLSIAQHLQFLRTLENPKGFGHAMKNIQNQVELGSIDDIQTSEQIDESNLAPTPLVIIDQTPPKSAPSSSSQPLQSANHSRWDEIRAANSRTTGNSAWDNIRQTHERTRDTPHPSEPSREVTMTEQERFDALLEKERNMK